MRKLKGYIGVIIKQVEFLTSQPLNKVDHAQPWPQSNHFLLANSLTMQEPPAKKLNQKNIQNLPKLKI